MDVDLPGGALPDAEVADEKPALGGGTSSPPPNCAICLGRCSNKCFTDCCLHQFCFGCLLQWSRVKAECPLCKQPFRSIIYNVRGNDEYEEHVVPPAAAPAPLDAADEDELRTPDYFLPNGPRPHRHFQFRYGGGAGGGSPVSISFRRAIYHNGWWAAGAAAAGVEGARVRACSPRWYRHNPGAAHRVLGWVNRELAALLADPAHIYLVQQQVMSLLPETPVLGPRFRRALRPHLHPHTQHFLYELSQFMQSPYDMMGYDANVRYNFRRPETLRLQVSSSSSESDVVLSSTSSSDSDVVLVEPAPAAPVASDEVILIRSDNSDSDVIYQAPTPPPLVVVSSDSGGGTPPPPGAPESPPRAAARLPIKLRLKLRKRVRDSSESDGGLARYRVARGGGGSSDSSSDEGPPPRPPRPRRPRRTRVKHELHTSIPLAALHPHPRPGTSHQHH